MSRNVALLILDTVRKDFFDRFAPRLNENADLSFANCYTASSWSAPSHASMITGKLPHQHGVHAHQKGFSNICIEDTFHGNLPGYRTTGASTNVFAGEAFDFDGLFDEFSSVNRYGAMAGGVNVDEFHHRHESGLGRYVQFLKEAREKNEFVSSIVNGGLVKMNDVLDKLDLLRFGDYGADIIIEECNRYAESEPFFTFANFMEAHIPHQPTRAYDGSLYDVPRGWSTSEVDVWEVNNSEDITEFEPYLYNYEQMYGASIDYLDRRLSEFIAELQANTTKKTTVVVTGDHGEELGRPEEDYLLGHAAGFSAGLLHVPLLVFNPPETVETDGLVSHLDLGRLITEMARDEMPDIERSLVPVERIGLGQQREPENYEYWNRAIRCVIEEDRKVEWDSLGNTVEYRLEGDSTQVEVETGVDVPDDYRALFDEPIKDAKRRAMADHDEDALDETTRDHLEELGYL